MSAPPKVPRLWVGVLAVCALLGTRLPFMAAGIDDLDSTNFVAGIESYSPPEHRPHPPGFPVFIFLAKAATAITGSPVRALTLVSAMAGSLACLPLFFLARRLFGTRVGWSATAITCFTPIVWFASVRPMSDAAGLLAGLMALALLVAGLDRQRARADLRWSLGAMAAGLAIGVRLQLLALVLPLFVYGWIVRRRLVVVGPALLAGAVLAWWLPMISQSRGFAPYFTAFRRTMNQAAAWEPLLSDPTSARALQGLHDVAIAPWTMAALAVPVLALALAGFVRAWRERRDALGLLLVMFLPYAGFNYFVQNTAATRYVIPAIPMVAVLAAVGLAGLSRGTVVLRSATAIYVVAASVLTVPALREYRTQVTPAVQAMRAIHRAPGDRPVMSGTMIFTRFSSYAPRSYQILSPREGNGWRRVTEHWRSREPSPVHFLLTPEDSLRGLLPQESIHDLGEWQWTPRVMRFMTGERPNVVRMARLDAPSWFLLRQRTYPGTNRADLGFFVRGDGAGHNVLLQGRSDWDEPQQVELAVDGAVQDRQWSRRSFLVQAQVRGLRRYSELTVGARGSISVNRVLAAKPFQPLFLPLTGIRRAPEDRTFHWLAREASVMAHVPAQGARLRLDGFVPEYLVVPPTLTVRWNNHTAATTLLSEPSFALTIALGPAATPWSELTLHTSRADSDEPGELQLTNISLD